jgi:hypothetical protein
MSRISHYVAKLVLRQTETSTFQVCCTKTRTEDMVLNELPGTILNMDNDREKEKNDSLGDNVQLSPITIFLRIWIVHASILKGLVCHVFIWLVLLHCVMTPLCLVVTPQNLLDLHTMTLCSVGGAATCIMSTDLQHHHTLLRNITC